MVYFRSYFFFPRIFIGNYLRFRQAMPWHNQINLFLLPAYTIFARESIKMWNDENVYC